MSRERIGIVCIWFWMGCAAWQWHSQDSGDVMCGVPDISTGSRRQEKQIEVQAIRRYDNRSLAKQLFIV
ncbi:MAG: hypothetical protein A2487_17760 [Candidatus Raymondbacteria bacterium RifOxyC12_full_50_8]|nr:MAG: hypothetical protein A2487_17760 [Candidatus Raymondbacteria bacterium RifOxyC12_full_50_8]OGP41688.1 MAG: hypothetical protein A2324_07635 [Candidatus Raymondbacteria bacterium RIFOXYB2_FULL_49_35]